ncbi:AI-2E family transporter [Thioclava sp. GXIMD4216]|uniref:AI-2E family transporter n=1 Tax=Thioclava litoralis TaxID=3076557 RepID=A0ABZ1E511_9RHOB|nr:AI-2E family transporter [Thioclava sp. FTW29]
MSRLETLSRIAVIFLGAVGVVFALVQVESIFAPMILALVAGIVLSPVSDTWEKMGFSPVWGALTSLIFSLLIVAMIVLIFQPLVYQIVDQAPKVWQDMRSTIDSYKSAISNLNSMSDRIQEAVSDSAAKTGEDGGGVQMPTLSDALMLAPSMFAQFLVFIGTLFFFLLTRSEVYAWVARHLSEPADRATTAKRLRAAERKVSRYFLTITLINAGLGLATGLVLTALGMPGAMLWGLVAFLINFVLYIGPACLIVALVFAGVAAFDGFYSLLPAILYASLNAMEGQFVTPALVGKHMRLNPLLVFLSLIFGIWLWGPVGGIVAIPLLLWGLVLADGLPESQAERLMATKITE